MNQASIEDAHWAAYRRDTDGLRRAYELTCINTLRALCFLEMHIEADDKYSREAVAYFRKKTVDYVADLLVNRPWEREWEHDWERETR